MAAPLDHVVVTNVSAPARPGDPALDADRVWYLLGFFLDACLPSVRAQTIEHTWLVWLDDRADPDLVAEVERIAEGVFTPLWRQAFDAVSVADAVARSTAAPRVATTLVACDDALARDCLAAVAGVADHHGEAPVRVEFPDGLTIDRTGGVFAKHSADAPVRALVAPRPAEGPIPTVVDALPHARLVTVTDRPMWIDVDHEPAEFDPPRGRRVDPSIVEERFVIDLAYSRARDESTRRSQRAQDLRRAGKRLLGHQHLGRWAAKALQGVRSLRWLGGETVNAAFDSARRRSSAAGLTRVAGDVEGVVSGDRVAVLAEFATSDEVRPWALRMAGALAGAGYPTLVVSARDRGRPVAPPPDLPDGVAVVSRANARQDFGGWAAALDAFPGLVDRRVLLTNDSSIGPLTGGSEELRALLARGEASHADVFAATRSTSGQDYLHSYFLLFAPGTLARPALRSFFADLPITRDRQDRGHRYEHALTALLRAEGIPHDAAWSPADFGLDASVNLALCWRELFDAGFPFLKRRLLTHSRFATVRPIILDHVRERYGVDLT